MPRNNKKAPTSEVPKGGELISVTAKTKKRRMTQKPTKSELDNRVLITAKLIAHGNCKIAIRRYWKETCDCAWRTVDRYIRLARDRAVERMNRNREDLIGERVQFLEAVLSDPDASTKDRLQASRDLCKLLGLNRPALLAFTDAEGKGPAKIQVEHLSTESLEVVDQLGAVLERATAGEMGKEDLARLKSIQDRMASLVAGETSDN